jgi:serine/threonine-protein kinase
MDTDRNLLFGALAFQNEYIDLAQFSAVCRAWGADKQRPLADLLVARGWITEQVRTVLDDMVERKLKRYGGNARVTLGAVADDSVRDAMRDVQDPEVRRAMQTLPAPAGHVLVETMVRPTETRSRYTLTRLHGEGGLGKVWVARDCDLNRDVALKELQPAQGMRPEACRRFLREAQVTGQLEHPNIVPVYELSRRPQDDQPFYTMRFVRGQTLRDAIADHQRRKREGHFDPVERHRLLGAFVAVCQAMAYAHSRGVVHRDLKPDNVLLGNFGEVIVLDWGLAKLVDKEDTEAAPVGISESASVDATMAGRVLGTPAYMAPEQADGRIDLIDSRTDVYGLGAILFEIVTGQPPHPHEPTVEMIRRIVSGEMPRARSLDSSVPPPLEAICAKAMARARPDRYFRASDLADDVQRWLADEPVSAYREPWNERLLRWARRHRTGTQAAAATLLVVTLVSVVAAIVVNNARRREQYARQAEAAAKLEATEHLRERREAVDELLTGVGDGLEDVPGAQRVRLQLLERAARTYLELASSKSGDPDLQMESAWARFRLGQVRDLLGQPEAAEPDVRSAESAFRTLLDADHQPAECRYGVATCQLQLGVILSRLGQTEQAQQAYDTAVRELESLLETDASAAKYRHQLARAQANLGVLHTAADSDANAERTLRRAIAGFTALAESNPGSAEYHYALASSRLALGQLLSLLGRNADAIEAFQTATQEFTELLAAAPNSYTYFEAVANCHLQLAIERRTLGDLDTAEATYRTALAEFETLADRERGQPRYRARLAMMFGHWGSFIESANQLAEAEQVLVPAVTAFAELAEANPRVAQYRESLATSCALLAQVHRGMGRNDEAATGYRRAIAEYESLIERDRAIPGYRAGLARSRAALGQVFAKLQQHADAETALESAIAELKVLAETHPQRPGYRDDLATCCTHLADLWHSTGRTAEAERMYREAIALRDRLAADFVSRADYQYELAWLLATCPNADLRDARRAVQLAERACSLAPQHGLYWNALGAAHLRAGNPKDAIAALEKSTQLHDGGDSRDFFLLAMAHQQLGDTDQAQTWCQQGIDWMASNRPDDPALQRLRSEAETAANGPK